MAVVATFFFVKFTCFILTVKSAISKCIKNISMTEMIICMIFSGSCSIKSLDENGYNPKF